MPLITISHGFGTEGYDIAQLVSQRLGVNLYDDERLKTIVKEMGVPTQSAYHFEEHAPGFWERLRSREPQVYLDSMEAAVYEIAQNGEGVIIGHGSQMLLRDFSCAFHVRLLSDIDRRVANLVSSQEISRDTAEKLIDRYDKIQKSFFRFAFQIELEKPSLYDMVINMGKLKNETISSIILEAIQSEDIQSCSIEALTSMKKLSLERKIHAELMQNNIDISTLQVSVPEVGKANLTGAAVSQEQKDQIPEIVKTVHGITDVETNLSVWISNL